MDYSDLPMIDWELATELAGGKKEFAKELLNLFVKSLPEDLVTIQLLYQKKKLMPYQKKSIAYMALYVIVDCPD